MTTPVASQNVIVVGAGLAGLAASYTALQKGSRVRLLERASKPGGNSIKASSGINGASTRFQPGKDTTFYSDTVRSSGSRLSSSDHAPISRVQREKLIGTLTESSSSAIDFLVDDIGVDLSVVAQLGGHTFPRTHRGAGKTPPGAAIVFALLAKLKEQTDFELVTDCEVTRLLTAVDDKHQVNGVEYTQGGTTKNLQGAVVFTTGGFAGDTWGQLAKHRPDLAGLPSTNDPRPATHSLLSGVGAVMVDMDSVQIHPTGFIEPSNPGARVKFLAAEMLRGEGGILLSHGRRFVNEMETREHVSKVVMGLPVAHAAGEAKEGNANAKDGGEVTQWDVEILLDPGACEAAASHIGFYLWKGLLTKQKVKELDSTTRQTIREYSEVVDGSRRDSFGRSVFGAWKLTGTSADDDLEVCIGKVTPVVHFTMGGAAISEKSQILATDEAGSGLKPVQGLWAAGEITGGIHGDNRLGGSSLLECVVFGRVAGAEAASYLNSKH